MATLRQLQTQHGPRGFSILVPGACFIICPPLLVQKCLSNKRKPIGKQNQTVCLLISSNIHFYMMHLIAFDIMADKLHDTQSSPPHHPWRSLASCANMAFRVTILFTPAAARSMKQRRQGGIVTWKVLAECRWKRRERKCCGYVCSH